MRGKTITPEKVIRAFKLYAALRERMEDCQIMLNLYHNDVELKQDYQREYNHHEWKAEVIERYIGLTRDEKYRLG
jgi:hypothetical protein